uniref:Tubulin--tyrosine ligase-like protein 5 n=1 Tax=Capitella teleta TaxID=283909 RepID=X1ZPC2_CAPTE
MLANRKSPSSIVWTGYGKKTPVLVFKAGNIVNKSAEIKAIGGKHHLAFKIVKTECKLLRTVLYAHGFHEVAHPNSNDFNLLWTGSHLKPYVLRSLQEFQKINHFPRSYEITRKDRLFKNIQRLQQTKGFKNFDFIPSSYIIPSEFQEFCSAFLKDKGPYIVKPIASSRGRGIFLINHAEQVPLDETMIVSKYVPNPLVIDGFKFDIRLYVAVTSYDPLIIYLYEEGLTRFATVKYEKSTKHIRNNCMHLTNYSVNKKSNDYVKNDDPDVEDFGNKWSLGAMLRYLRSIGKDTTGMMMRIEDVLIKTLLAAEVPIATACKMFMPFRGNCFGLYGFDILVDENLRPWVIEVNLSPSLAWDSPLDLKIKSNMMADLFSLVGFVCQDPMVRKTPSTKLPDGKPSSRSQASMSRPYSSHGQRGDLRWTAKEGRPSSASSNKGSGGTNVIRATGLTGEEIRVVRRAKEEYQRRGGWVRIFPSPESWELYGSIHLHSAQNPQLQLSSQADQALAAALQRSSQYERKLSCLGDKRKAPKSNGFRIQNTVDTSTSGAPFAKGGTFKGTLVQGVLPDRAAPLNPPAPQLQPKVTRKSKPAELVIKLPEKRMPSPPSEKTDDCKVSPPPPLLQSPPPPTSAFQSKPEPRFDVVSLLETGKTLRKVQARFAFATYLMRVQHRLMAQTSAGEDDDVEAANEQMDLVLRFLKRAAGNLQQAFKVVVPSRKLVLNDRRRILAKQLGDFVHIYNKETDVLRQKNHLDKRQSKRPPSFTQNEGLDDGRFHQFVNSAGENDLEEVLTTYTKINKSASIFLGSKSDGSNSHQYHHLDTTLVRRKDSFDGSRNPVGAVEEVQVTRGTDGDVALMDSSRPATYLRAVTIYSNKSGLRGLHGGRPSSASMARGNKGDPYDEEAINSALQRLAVRQQQRQYAASSSLVALSQEDVAKMTRERKGANETFQSFVTELEHPSMNVSQHHQQLRQMRMGEQSRALLEHSKAKHQAMVAQAHAAKSHPPIIFHSVSRDSLLPLNQEEDESFSVEPNRAPKPPIKPSSVRKPTSIHRMARTNLLDNSGSDYYNKVKYDHHTGTSKPVYSSGHNIGQQDIPEQNGKFRVNLVEFPVQAIFGKAMH